MALSPTVLRRMDLFTGLDAPALEHIVRRGHTRRIARGRNIFRQNERPVACHALISGRVRIAQSAHGESVVMRYVGPGEIFGAVALFHGGGYPADAAAITDCVEIQWAPAAMMDLMARYPRIAINALRIVGTRLDELQKRLKEVMTQPAEQRLAQALLRLVQQAGSKVERGIEIGFPLSRKDLAAITGTAHFTVSRILSDWQDRGIVEGARRRIVVCNLRALQTVAAAADERAP